MKIYDVVFTLLETIPEDRDSDKKLIWDVYNELGYITSGNLNYFQFIKKTCPSMETIRRCRQKIQETHPELEASTPIKKYRKLKQQTKGDAVLHEVAYSATGRWDFSTGTAVWIEGTSQLSKIGNGTNTTESIQPSFFE